MDHIRVTQQDGILSLTLNRPDKKNAITDAMYGALADALVGANDDKATRAILIQAEGDTFTAGNDLADFANVKTSAPDAPANVLRFLDALVAARKPLVAAAQGNAVGVGATMLLHCDYVILADDAVLIAPFVNLALVPEAASSLLLPARIGHVRAYAMFALGAPTPAQTALDWGLANQIAAPEALRAKALKIAQKLASLPPRALAGTKELMREGQALRAQIAQETTLFAAQLASPEAREAFAAFAEKRKPDFSRFQ